MWTCFRAKCGWKGTTRVSFWIKLAKYFYWCYSHLLLLLCFQAFADVKSTYATMNKITKIKQPTRVITEESLGLEPLCNEVIIVTIITIEILFYTHRQLLFRNYLLKACLGNYMLLTIFYWRTLENFVCGILSKRPVIILWLTRSLEDLSMCEEFWRCVYLTSYWFVTF